MKTFTYSMTVLLLLCLAGWAVSLYMAPYTMEHGYLITAARYLAGGLIPWQDVNLMDAPLGVGILSLPYCWADAQTGGWLGLLTVAVVHVINLLLLGRLLTRLNVSGAVTCGSLALYVLLLYSVYGLTVCLEPLAVCFLLLSLILALSTQRWKNGGAGVFLALAMLCKVQTLVLIPAVLAFCGMPHRLSGGYRQRVQVLGGTLVVTLLLGYGCIYMWTGCEWLGRVEWTIHPAAFSAREILVKWILLLVHCVAFLLCPVWLCARQSDASRCRASFWAALLAVLGVMALYVWGSEKAWPQLALPFLTVAVALTWQEYAPGRPWVGVLVVLAFLCAGGLAGREFLKLDMGHAKETQQQLLDKISKPVPAQAETLIVGYRRSGYDVAGQLFSERHLKPYRLRETRYGFVDGRNPQPAFEGYRQADAVVIPSRITFGLKTFREDLNHAPWTQDFTDFVCNTICAGTLDLTVVLPQGYSDSYLQDFLEGAEFEDEHEHEHENEHPHGHEHNHDHED